MISGSNAYGIVATIMVIGGAIMAVRSQVPKQTIANLKELSDSQAKLIAELRQSQLDNVKAIGELRGELQSYKDLPFASFKDLADGIKQVVAISQSNADSNLKILQVLQNTSAINAQDRETLTHQ